MKLHTDLIVLNVVTTVHQDGTKLGITKVWHKGMLVLTKEWNGTQQRDQINQEIKRVTTVNKTPVLKLVA